MNRSSVKKISGVELLIMLVPAQVSINSDELYSRASIDLLAFRLSKNPDCDSNGISLVTFNS